MTLFPDLAPAPEPSPTKPRWPPADPRFPGACPLQLRYVWKGLHPMGHALPGPEGETCGTCGHHYVKRTPRRFQKCHLTPATGGLATDTRVRWPACAKWEVPS